MRYSIFTGITKAKAPDMGIQQQNMEFVTINIGCNCKDELDSCIVLSNSLVLKNSAIVLNEFFDMLQLMKKC